MLEKLIIIFGLVGWFTFLGFVAHIAMMAHKIEAATKHLP